MSESEDDTQVTEQCGGRKSRLKARIQKKEVRIKNKEPRIVCSHGLMDIPVNKNAKGKKECEAADLTFDDITTFNHRVMSLNQVDQNKFLLHYMNISQPKRRVVESSTAKRKQTVSVKYSVRKNNGEIIPVCAATFQGICGLSKDRLACVAKIFQATGKLPDDKRGGNRSSEKHKELTRAVMNNISSYKCRESHYSRGKSRRGYLPSNLSVNKMWKSFCDKRKSNGFNICSLSKYKHIFYHRFNLSFKTPHTDTCSICKVGLMKIKAEMDLEKKNVLRTNYRLHKLRAKRFYSLMKEDNPDIMKVCMDMQQNQPIPKLSVSEVFYARQVWLYNLCIMTHKQEQSKEDIYFYTWLETESSRGCNQIASALQTFLCELEKKQEKNSPKIIHLFSDSCVSQNKNSVIMATLIAFLEHSKHFCKVVHIFPIGGHSYMPPDRVFGRLEKCYRKLETILSPKEYHDVLKEHGTVKILNADWQVRDFKSRSQMVLRSKLPFKMSNQRAICYEKIQKTVRVSVRNTYFVDKTEVEVLKKKQNIYKVMKDAPVLHKQNMVSKEKKKDVSNLLKYFEVPADSKDFYEDILQ